MEMAYAAAISLDETINRLLHSFDRISISSSSRNKLKNVVKLLKSLKAFLESLDGHRAPSYRDLGRDDFERKVKRYKDARGRSSERLTSLAGQIRDSLYSFEDLLDSILSDESLSLSKTHRRIKRGPSSTVLSLDLDTDEVWLEMKTLAKTVNKLMEEFDRELERLILNEDENAAEVARRNYIDSGVDMVGRSFHFTEIKEQILRIFSPTDFTVFSILGVLGTGRTNVARNIFEDLLMEASGKYFDCGAWVSVGPNFQIGDIIATVISQLGESSNYSRDDTSTPSEHLYDRLKNRRYMIVLDDIHEECVWNELRSSFPDQENGSVVILTTGVREVALSAKSLQIFEMTVYGEKESWEIVEKGIFGEKSCPLELEEAGKKIANNCGGHRIVLAKVVVSLLKTERKVDIWNELAENKENPIFMVADELSEITTIEDDCSQLLDTLDDIREEMLDIIAELIFLSDIKEEIIRKLFPEMYYAKLQIIYLVGMAGVGKTKLAKKLVKDSEILGRFDNYVWLTLGPKYNMKNIVGDILATLSPPVLEVNFDKYPDLAKRWLIVLDDVWDDDIFYNLEAFLPNIRGIVFVITRKKTLPIKCRGVTFGLDLLNEEESWSLFCKKVFSSGSCPSKLEEAGKKIAANCEGLPLLILTVADALSKSEDMTPEFWNTVAKNKQHSVFMDAHEAISKELYPSYEYLPQYLRLCFLYMGAFPQNYLIPTSNLIKLLSVDGFLEPDTLEQNGRMCPKLLLFENLVLSGERGTDIRYPKSYTLHSSFWYLSNRIAKKTEFLHVLDIFACADDSTEDTKNQRRLCIRNSIMLIIEDVYNIIESSSCARSFLCFGPFNQYPVPIYLGLRLLRVLNALTIRLYEFPVEAVELIHLRYLALTCDGSLPPSISKLWFLQFLIVNHYLSIRSSKKSLYLPLEIWNMKELKYVHVPGSILPDPTTDDTCLPNLETLSEVSPRSCTEKILRKMPNLRKLGIRIELPPVNDGEELRCLNLESSLPTLESLSYVVMNPSFMSDAVAPSIRTAMFPWSLVKLKLSGLGYPWEYMSIIGKLKNLEKLKLQCYAFRGPEWNVENGSFTKLESLVIEDCDLMHWNANRWSFPVLRYLSIKHCYKLKELPYLLANCMWLIEVVDCNPFVEKWATHLEGNSVEIFNNSYKTAISIVSSR